MAFCCDDEGDGLLTRDQTETQATCKGSSENEDVDADWVDAADMAGRAPCAY